MCHWCHSRPPGRCSYLGFGWGRVSRAQPPRSQTLALPLWQGPGLDELLAGDGVGAEAKRRLWSQIGEWQAQWSDGTRGDGAGGDGARDDSDGA